MDGHRTYHAIDDHAPLPCGPAMFYECMKCGDTVESLPAGSVYCSCGNIAIDVDYGRLSIKDFENARCFTVVEDEDHPTGSTSLSPQQTTASGGQKGVGPSVHLPNKSGSRSALPVLGVFAVALALQVVASFVLPSGIAGAATSSLLLLSMVFWYSSCIGWLVAIFVYRPSSTKQLAFFLALFVLVLIGAWITADMTVSYGMAT